MVTKVYGLKRNFAAHFETKYCGVVVDMDFKLGVGTDSENKAEMVVTDRFTQDAIESDPRFGHLFFLTAQYGEPDPEPVVETKAEEQTEAKPGKKASKKSAKKEDGKVFKTMNDAVYYLEEELGVEVPEGADIKDVLKANNITIEE